MSSGPGGGYGPPPGGLGALPPMPGGSGGGGGGGYGPPAGQLTERMSVGARLCGLVIGRGGECIKDIQARSGANIKLDREHGPDPVEKDFIITGTPEQIQAGKDMIQAKLDEQVQRRNSNSGGGGGVSSVCVRE